MSKVNSSEIRNKESITHSLKEFRVTACQDNPDGIPGPSWAHYPGVQVVPSWSHLACCQFPSTQPGKADLTLCDDGQTCCHPIDLPLIRVIQLNWWQWVDHSVGDITSASGFQ